MDSTASKKISATFNCFIFLMSFCSAVSGQANYSKCSNNSVLYERLTVQLQEFADCAETPGLQFGERQAASLLDNLHRVRNVLEKQAKSVCSEASPQQCPVPIAHSKGGLVCVTIGEVRYCKPMCNEGYDFSFLRRSRLYEECSLTTGFKWSTQYDGGRRLALCNKYPTSVSGAETAYFPENQDCLKTKSDEDLERPIVEKFVAELKGKGIEGKQESPCLYCG